MWEGGLILKNSLFPTKLLITEGDIDVVDQLMKVTPASANLSPYVNIYPRGRGCRAAMSPAKWSPNLLIRKYVLRRTPKYYFQKCVYITSIISFLQDRGSARSL